MFIMWFIMLSKVYELIEDLEEGNTFVKNNTRQMIEATYFYQIFYTIRRLALSIRPLYEMKYSRDWWTNFRNEHSNHSSPRIFSCRNGQVFHLSTTYRNALWVLESTAVASLPCDVAEIVVVADNGPSFDIALSIPSATCGGRCCKWIDATSK